MIKFRIFPSLLLAVLCVSSHAHAQSFPSKQVRIVVAFNAGGGVDATARAFGAKLSEYWGQTVIVENKPGASGMVGAEAVARSSPDGYTLLLCSPSEIAINPALYPKMSYDPFTELAPISLAVLFPDVVVVRAGSTATTLKDLIALSKTGANGLSYGTSGIGSTQHITGEWLSRNAGMRLVHVPYKGAAPATADLIGGHIAMAILGPAPVIPHIRAGRLQAVAVAGARRSAVLPDVPTLIESGIQWESSQWFGFLAPTGTPADVIAKIAADVKRAAAETSVRDQMAALGGEPVASTPQEFGALIRSENAKFARIIKEAGIKAE